jgi:hypothetical protein
MKKRTAQTMKESQMTDDGCGGIFLINKTTCISSCGKDPWRCELFREFRNILFLGLVIKQIEP